MLTFHLKSLCAASVASSGACLANAVAVKCGVGVGPDVALGGKMLCSGNGHPVTDATTVANSSNLFMRIWSSLRFQGSYEKVTTDLRGAPNALGVSRVATSTTDNG